MGIRQLRVCGIIFLFFGLLLAGCKGAAPTGSVAEQKERKPSKIHQTFLYYSEEYKDDDGTGFGSLFLKTLGSKEIDKVATDVKEYDFMYDNENNKVLFISSENVLYEYEKGDSKVKLAEDVRTYRIENKKVPVSYQNDWDDLYIVKEDKDVEKIASDVSQYVLIDNNMYYVNHSGSFKKYNIETRVEEEIASDVYYFVNFNKNGDLAYINDDHFLYYRNGKDGKIVKISSESVSQHNIQIIDNKLVYMGTDSSGKTGLYLSDITGEGKTDKIANDVLDYTYVKGTYYYTNYDDNLYSKKANEDAAKKIASEVYHFNVDEKGTLYIGDGDNNLFKLDSKDNKEKVATDVQDYTLTADGDIIYYNADDELFVNDKKITSNLEDYGYLYGNLVYATEDDKIYIMENMKEAQVVDEDVSTYSSAFYHNKMVYRNLLEFKDIAGIWKMDDDEFIEIDKNGKLRSLTYEYIVEHEVIYSDFQTLSVRSEEGQYFDIVKTDDESLVLEYGYGDYYATKSSREEMDKFLKEQKEEADRNEVSAVVEDYIYYSDRAVYYGDIEYVAIYIASQSDFYDQQDAYVKNMYNENMEELHLDSDILDINKINEDHYEVTAYEKISISNWVTEEETTHTYKNRYTVERIDGEFLITNLVVEEESGSKL